MARHHGQKGATPPRKASGAIRPKAAAKARRTRQEAGRADQHPSRRQEQPQPQEEPQQDSGLVSAGLTRSGLSPVALGPLDTSQPGLPAGFIPPPR